MSKPELSEKIDRFEHYFQQDPNNLSLTQALSELYIKNGDLEKATQFLTLSLEKFPGDIVLLFHSATLHMATRDFDTAIHELQTISAVEAHNKAIEYNLAYCHFMQGKHAQAAQFLMPLVKNEQPMPQAILLLARAYHYQGMIDEAINLLDLHQALFKKNPEALGILSLLYFDNDDVARATELARKCYQLNTSNIEALLVLSFSHIRDGKLAESESMLEEVTRQQPDNGRALVGLGLRKMMAGDLLSAQAFLIKATQVMPSHLGTWHTLGWCQLLMRQLEKAKATFQEVYEIDHNFAESHGALAIIDVIEGNRNAAEHKIRIAQRLDKNCYSAQYANALLKLSDGKAIQAEAELISILDRTDVPNKDYYIRLLRNQLALGNLAAAPTSRTLH